MTSLARFEKEHKNSNNHLHPSALFKQFKSADPEEIKALEKKLDTINRELAEKNRVIYVYENLLTNLKGKIMEKV